MAARERAATQFQLLCYTKRTMKFLRPTISKQSDKKSTPAFTSSTPKAPTSFGEKRAQEMSSRLEKARAERDKLIRAEYAASGSVQENIQQKRLQKERTIASLSSKEDTKKY